MTQEEIQKALEAIGKAGITVQGDLVLEKKVEHEIGNVEAGGIGIQIINGKQKLPEKVNTVIPEKLKTAESDLLMAKLVDAGLLDDNWQPVKLSGTERALVAKAISERLEINELWQVFGQLWDEKPETLRGYLNKALDQQKSLKFQDRLRNILG